MQESISVIEERIRLAPERFIRPLLHRSRSSLKIEVVHVRGEPIPYGEAVTRPFEAFKVGDAWGAMWDTTWFKFYGTVPLEWQGKQVVGVVNLSCEDDEGSGREGLVWMDGKPVISVNKNCQSVPILESAMGGESIEFYVEAAANPKARLSWGDGDLLMPDYKGDPLYKLQVAELATHDEEVYQLLMDFTSASDAMFVMSRDQPRRGQLLRALNEVCKELELDDHYCIQHSREALRNVLGKRNGDTNHEIVAVGHARIDRAWCLPIRETIRKCARTFSTVLRYMERYPDFHFSCSQPVHYLWMRKYYPSIYSDIKKQIKCGKWEVIGSMWVEADCNISSGESLIRQIIHGKNFFMDEFGVKTRDLWLPDVFGCSASLPQILKKSGVDSFLTQKISCCETNQFPHHTFLWRGLDGSEIFTHFSSVDTSNRGLKAAELTRSQVNFKETERASMALVPYGFGDGGGSTIDQIERARRYNDFEGLPKVEMGTVSHFCEQAKVNAVDPPVWQGELYVESHRGSYTSQAYVKMMNRRCELLLRDAEMLQVIMQALGEDDLLDKMPAVENVPMWDVQGHIKAKKSNLTARALDRAWKLLLLNQGYDILPGSSIHWVYEDSRIDYSNIETIALAVRDAGMKKLCDVVDTSDLAEPVVVFNSLSHVRYEVVEIDEGKLAMVTAPQCGYTVISQDAIGTLADGVAAVTVECSDVGYIIQNGMILLEIDHNGLIARFFDLENYREVLVADSVGNLFQLHKDFPNKWNALDIDSFYKDNVEGLDGHGVVSITMNTDLRVVVHVSRAFGDSQIEQDIIIDAGSRRVDFKTEVDWQERNKLLKVSFPVDISSSRASYDVQYGHVERATHTNSPWGVEKFEVPAQKWADLSEADYGVALLNNSKYGYNIQGNNLRLTLLKAANAPDPKADRGVHQFTYSLLPHRSTLQAGEVIEQAYALNVPLVLQKTDPHAGELPQVKSFFSVNKPGVVIEAVKRAERTNAAVVRIYEAYQTRGEVSLTSSIHTEASASEVDMMEDALSEVESYGGEVTINIKPFEIKTIQFLENS